MDSKCRPCFKTHRSVEGSPAAHEVRVVSADGLLRLSERSGPLKWNFRHDPFICRVCDSRLANNFAALAANLKKPAVVVV
jgi:hypothetical protein